MLLSSQKVPKTNLENKHLLGIHLLLDADATKLSGQMQILFPQTALATAKQSELSVQLLPIPVQILE